MGDAQTQFDLSQMYRSGQGVTQDVTEARKWLRMAAEHGHAGAQVDLGNWYSVRPRMNYAEAAKWYRKAAEQGDSTGRYWLAEYSADGRGVPQDNVMAHMWYSLTLVANPGWEVAAQKRQRLAERMTPAEIAEAENLAREWKPSSN